MHGDSERVLTLEARIHLIVPVSEGWYSLPPQDVKSNFFNDRAIYFRKSKSFDTLPNNVRCAVFGFDSFDK